MFNSIEEAALGLWNFFYLASEPRVGEEKHWYRIAQSTVRLRESVAIVGGEYPLLTQRWAACCLQRTVHEIRDDMQKLSELPDWIIHAAEAFAIFAELFLAETASPATSSAF